MRVSRLWCGTTTPRSLATMGRYPKAIKMLLKLVDYVDRSVPWWRRVVKHGRTEINNLTPFIERGASAS
jgi:hypothetical protein